MYFFHVVTSDLNALLPSAVQTVNGICKIFTRDIEVDCAANFFKRVPVLEDAAAQKLLQPREESEIGRCKIGRVRWVGEKLEMKSLKSFGRTHGSVRPRVVVQEESWCRSVSPLVPDVLQIGQGLDVAFAIDSRPFTQELYLQWSQAVEEECEHHLSTVLVASGFQEEIVPLLAQT